VYVVIASESSRSIDFEDDVWEGRRENRMRRQARKSAAAKIEDKTVKFQAPAGYVRNGGAHECRIDSQCLHVRCLIPTDVQKATPSSSGRHRTTLFGDVWLSHAIAVG